MAKSPDAFRTISEVSAWLETPPHVLRFWESKFPQVKPVKRAGGRRYYRPEDMALLGGIKVLLHEQGMTIRGVQKMLREQGVRHVSSLSAQAWEEMGEDALGEGAGGDEAVLDEAPGEVPGEVDADGTPLDGVIVGPWSDSGAGQGAAGEAEEAEADLADLAALDGPVVEEAEEPGPPAPAPTLIEAFLAGTLSRLAQGEAGATAAHSDGTQPGAFVGAPPVAPAAALPEAHPAGGPSRTEAGPIASERPPLPPGEPSLARALDLLRRADPERLRARADRIAPLLLRLRRLRDGLPRPSA